ncbi:hypothetical protein QBC46DRAFT_271645, partial [Diplogelasinospora grovesii]
AVLVLVTIVGATLGGVLGTRARASATGSSATTSGPATASVTVTTGPSATPSPASNSSVRINSAIAVTGWTNSGAYSVRLFYQGGDSQIRLSSYESSTGSWGSQVLPVKAKAGTSLAASSIYEAQYFGFTDTSSGFQLEMFYISEQNTIKELAGRDSTFSEGSLSSLGLSAPSNMKIVTYWPSIVYQNAAGKMEDVLLNNGWHINDLTLAAYSGSSLAEVPFHSTYPDGGNSLFYQGADGKLVQAVGNYTAGWASGNLSIAIPLGTSIGAFAVSNKRKGPNLDTYVLYQAQNGTIEVMWQDDETGWKGPSAPDALQSADNGTSIACLTPMAWEGTTIQQGFVNMSRCYFQGSGKLKEVWFDGTDWNVVGDIPTS